MNRLRGSPVCICKGCRAEVRHPARNEQKTTTSLKRHSESCGALKRYWWNHSSRQPSTLNEFFASRLVKGQNKSSITTANVREEVLSFFVSENVPFSQVDNSHFQHLLQWILSSNGAPLTSPISRKTVRADLTRQAQVAKGDLKSILANVNSKISLALDCWTSRNCFAFLGTFL